MHIHIGYSFSCRISCGVQNKVCFIGTLRFSWFITELCHLETKGANLLPLNDNSGKTCIKTFYVKKHLTWIIKNIDLLNDNSILYWNHDYGTQIVKANVWGWLRENHPTGFRHIFHFKIPDFVQVWISCLNLNILVVFSMMYAEHADQSLARLFFPTTNIRMG